MMNAPKANEQIGPQGWMRSLAKQSDGLRKTLRMVRFALLLGPWSGALMWAMRRISPNPPVPRSAATVFPGVAAGPFVKQLKDTGLATGIVLPSTSVEKILAYSQTHFESLTGHVDCDEIRQIAFDPVVLDVAKGYLGGEPVFYGSLLFWTNPNTTTKTTRPERFHYDVADFKSLCAFFYITDALDEQCGPHVLIEGTHKRTNLSQLLTTTVEDDIAAQRYGTRVRVLTGPGGSGFFEDQVAFHKRLPCRQRRLALMVSFTSNRKPDPTTKIM
jgi:hypothetical protein